MRLTDISLKVMREKQVMKAKVFGVVGRGLAFFLGLFLQPRQHLTYTGVLGRRR